MSITANPSDRRTALQGTRLRIGAALLACVFAIAVIAFGLSVPDKAHAEGNGPSSDLSASAIPKPGFTSVYNADDTPDVQNGDSIIILPNFNLVPSDCASGPVYTVEPGAYAGLSHVEIVDQKTGKLKLYTNGLANGRTDTVIVSLTGMGNYEDSTIIVHVSYADKLVASYVQPLPEAATNLVYNGEAQKGYTGELMVKFRTSEGKDTTYDVFEVTYTGTANNGTPYGPTDQAPRNAGSYTVTLSLPAYAPCVADPLALKFTIGMADAPDLEYSDARLLNQNTLRATFAPTKGNPVKAGETFVYQVKSFTGNGLANAEINPETGELTLTANGKASTQTVDTVTIVLSGMGNYQDATATMRVTYVPRPKASPITGPVAAANLVYNGKAQAGYTGDPSVTYVPYGEEHLATYTGPFDISYAGTGGTAYGPTDQAPTAAGSYTVTFSLPDTAPCSAEPLVLEFSLAQAPLSPEAGKSDTAAGKTLAATGDSTLPAAVAALGATASLAFALAARSRKRQYR